MSYVPHTPEDIEFMLKTIGASSLEELLSDIPKEVRFNRDFELPGGLSELEIRTTLGRIAAKNADLDRYVSFLGAGAYDHYIPSVVSPILFRSEYYTAYTPYQAELSQGMLQAIYEFQTAVCELTGMEIANASLYDGASALAEAVLMMVRIAKKRSEILICGTVNPLYRQVVESYCQGLELHFVEVPFENGVVTPDQVRRLLSDKTAGILIQNPNFFGNLEPVEEIIRLAHEKGAKAAVSVDPVSLGLLKPPGEWGADIVVGEGQALGNSLNFGGPYVGFFAARMEHARQIPGRIVGATRDANGKKGFCLTLQTREQHIRRERATSNICTNETLNALAMLFSLVILGREGLGEMASQSARKAHYLKEGLCRIPGISSPWNEPFFKEFVVRTKEDPKQMNERLLREKIIGGLDLGKFYPALKNHILFCVTEKRTRGEMDHLLELVSKT